MTGSQTLYGEASLQTVSEHSARLAAALDGLDSIPVRVVPRPTATSADAILQLCLEANVGGALCRRSSRGCTRSRRRRCGSPGSALQKPLLHLHTQFNRDLPWAEIDMEFMNLNQSAHGDREFGLPHDAHGLRRARPSSATGAIPRSASGSALWTRAAVGWHEAHELRVARFGDNMRDVAVTEGDKVEAQMRFGVSVNGYGIDELAAAVDAARRRRDRRARRRIRRELRRRAAAAPGGRAPGVVTRRRSHRGRAALLPRSGRRSRPSPTRSKISTA